MGWVVVREDGSRVVPLQPILLPPLSRGGLHCRNTNGLHIVEPAVPVLRKQTPHPWAVVQAVALSALACWLFYAYLLAQAKIHHGPPNVFYKFVDASMLDPSIVLQYVILPLALFILFYPVMGLFVTYLSGAFAVPIGRVYEFPRDRSRRLHPDTLLIYAASWPVTVWLIPMLVFALGMGIIYRSFWR
jgi:uncharacterized protein with PQ loop repeat